MDIDKEAINSLEELGFIPKRFRYFKEYYPKSCNVNIVIGEDVSVTATAEIYQVINTLWIAISSRTIKNLAMYENHFIQPMIKGVYENKFCLNKTANHHAFYKEDEGIIRYESFFKEWESGKIYSHDMNGKNIGYNLPKIFKKYQKEGWILI